MKEKEKFRPMYNGSHTPAESPTDLKGEIKCKAFHFKIEKMIKSSNFLWHYSIIYLDSV
jgi:hypothetical protein